MLLSSIAKWLYKEYYRFIVLGYFTYGTADVFPSVKLKKKSP